MSPILWLYINLQTLLVLRMVSAIKFNRNKIDQFIERIIASEKFNKVAEMIAQKTIEGLQKFEVNNNNINDTVAQTAVARANNKTNEKELRRDSNFAQKEMERNKEPLNSLSDLSFKYKKLLLNFKKDPINDILNITGISTELRTRDSDAEEVNYKKNETSNIDGSGSVEREELKNENDTDYESDTDDTTDELDLLDNVTIKEKSGESTKATTVDIFSSKQRDLHKRKTMRKEGDKTFVFNSSSDYEEYHEKVNEILKN